jgi:peptide/nickel transport system permease protein
VLRFLIRRILSGALVLWIVTSCVFVLFFATSPDPAARFAGKMATPETLALLRHRMGLDQPLPVQYWRFVTGLLHGDLGYSYATRSPVAGLVEQSLPPTFSLVAGGTVLTVLVGVLSGVLSARRARSLVDRGVAVVVLLGMSVPVFITGMTLLYLFGLRLPIFPLAGYVPIRSSPAGWLHHMLLPWATGAFLQSAIYTRLTRGSLLDVLNEDYVRTARAKGLTERRVVYRHALRSALTPVVTQFGLDLGGVLSGALVTDTVFGLQGIGQLSVRSMTNGDLPVIMALVLLAAFGVVVANIVVDVVYAALDPRVQHT